ncbi:MAG: transporter substrate-binding domain-containing protein, partial [Firmicutes bacterium]|nr:transporter substrate-binding domain-containing protein [Bacillota bacterium]
GAFTEELFGIAVKKGNTELLEQINEVLAELEESGKFDELLTKWFE